MNLFYTLAYAVGFTPWERASEKEAERIAALFDREQAGRSPPYGKALDLGCGTGMQAVELARRGWQVTGVDLVAKAVRAARERSRAAGMDIHFVQGDVTRLTELGIGAGFTFVLDFGLFHGLEDAQRAALGREVNAATAPGATLLMIAWAPGRRTLLPRGAARADIEGAFAGWQITAEDPIPASALPRPLKNVDPRFYRLQRTAPGAKA
jgi:SAM-dependent methyltransferase